MQHKPRSLLSHPGISKGAKSVRTMCSSIFNIVVSAIQTFIRSGTNGAALFIPWFRGMNLSVRLQKSAAMLKSLKKAILSALAVWLIHAAHVISAKMGLSSSAEQVLQ